MQFTPQQLSGGGKYGGGVKIGNWAEDRARRELEAKDYERRRAKGQLASSTYAAALEAGSQSVPHAYSSDGFVHYGDAVVISVSEEDSKGLEQTHYLSIDPGMEVDPAAKTVVVTAGTTGKPQARNCFVIQKASGEAKAGEVVCYGDPVYLCSNPSLRLDAATKMVRAPYHLASEQASTLLGSGSGGSQSAFMTLYPSALAGWAFVAADGNALATDGTPVPANKDVAILHRSTNVVLGARLDSRVTTNFGSELLVKCQTYTSTGRGKGASYLQGNRWRLVTASDPSAAVDNRELNEITPEFLLGEIRKTMAARGAYGIRGIARAFRIMDDAGDGKLDADDFKWGLRDMGVPLADEDMLMVKQFFDRDNCGKIDLTEFLVKLRGPMNAERLAVVKQAYDKLDSDGSGLVTLQDLKGVYNPSFHPGVEDGSMTPEEALTEFLGNWETHRKDGIVTLDEFNTYYSDISASIDDDNYFVFMMQRAWGLDEE